MVTCMNLTVHMAALQGRLFFISATYLFQQRTDSKQDIENTYKYIT